MTRTPQVTGPPFVWEAGVPVTTSVQGVVPVPLLMPKDHEQVVSAASQVRFNPTTVHCSAVAIMDTESALGWDGAARARPARREEAIRPAECILRLRCWTEEGVDSTDGTNKLGIIETVDLRTEKLHGCGLVVC